MMRGQPRRNRPSLFHRIGLRILLLNVLIVFVPVAIVLLLDTYEEQLLDQLERSLVQQGRTISASLSLEESLDAESAQALLGALAGRHESRIRVLDAGGRLLADTSTLGSAESDETAANRATPSPDSGAEEDPDLATTTREQFIYRFASAPVRSFRRLAGDPDPAVGSADFYNDNSYSDGSEVRAALAGRYGASTRVSSGGQISVTLYSAIPIRQEDRIVGAVLVSQSTFRILQSIYRVRVDANASPVHSP